MSIPSVSETTVDRLPPHAPDMEMGVLGCCLISPNECLGECVEKLKDDGKDAFYDLRHQMIYEAMVAMFDKRKPIDLITVHQNLKDRQLLEQIGGIAYLSQLQDSVPSAANLSYYLEAVKEKYLLRKMIQTCSGVVGRIYDYEGNVDSLLDECDQQLQKILSLNAGGAANDIKSITRRSIDKIEARFNSRGEIQGIKTGFPDLDQMTDGMHGGEMIVIAARPSVGKSSLMMNIAENVVLEQRLPVGVFSLEMSAESLVTRSIGSVARVNMMRPWEWSESQFMQQTNAASRISNSKLVIDDTAGLSILQLRARARKMVQQHGIKLFCVDYLQLLKGNSKKAADNRQVEISEISGGIKALAKELNVPVIVLAQLNRDVEKNQRPPRVSDLRESGSIEQDADVVGLLFNRLDDEGIPMTNGANIFQCGLNIAKQRNGPTGEIGLTFFKEHTRFETAANKPQDNETE